MAVDHSSPAAGIAGKGTINNRLGLAYMLAGMSLFATTDAIAKLLTENLSPLQVVWSRQFGLLAGVLIFIAIRGLGVLRTSQPKLQIGRGVLAACSATLFIMGISYMPLADAVAITFVAPFMVTIMGAVLLKEPVGIRRWTAVVIGFVGTLIVIRPGMGVFHPAAILLILAAAAFAGRQVLSRVLANGDGTGTTVAYTAIVSWGLLCLPIPFVWQMPETGRDFALLAIIAVCAAGGETLIIMALDIAHAVVLAPVQYILLLWGTMYGFVLFGQLPDGWTILGAIIIMATGIYIVQREYKVRGGG
ncbi:MAG: DMT family transporter [Pseudomonadota bacterium]